MNDSEGKSSTVKTLASDEQLLKMGKPSPVSADRSYSTLAKLSVVLVKMKQAHILRLAIC